MLSDNKLIARFNEHGSAIDTCLVCGKSIIGDHETCPYCRVKELEAENARFVDYAASRMFDVDIDKVTEFAAQQVREFVNSTQYQRLFGKKSEASREAMRNE